MRDTKRMTTPVENSTLINANTSAVWEALTHPAKMKAWMGEPEMNIEIITDWKVGSPVIVKGFHHVKFENSGAVLQFEPGKVLEYNYLSSLSHLPAHPENYTMIKFELAQQGNQTLLTLTVSNFPTETIYKHLELYWRGTMEVIKRIAEKQPDE